MNDEERKIIQDLKERLDDDYNSAWYYQEYIENALNLFGKLELKIDKLERTINMMSEYIVGEEEIIKNIQNKIEYLKEADYMSIDKSDKEVFERFIRFI